MQDHDPFLLPGKRGVEQLPREHQRRARQNEEDRIELAALRSVHGEGVSEFKAGLPLLAEVGVEKLEHLTCLGGELDFEVVGKPFFLLRATVADNHANLAVRKIAPALRLGVDPKFGHRLIAAIYDLVAIDDLGVTHRLGNAAVSAWIARLVDLLTFVANVNHPVEWINTPRLLAHRTKNLPRLGLLAGAGPAAIFDIEPR